MTPASPLLAATHGRRRIRRRAVTIDSRYRAGVAELAHGGYAGGLLATALDAPAAEVRFETPIPVGCELMVRRAPEGRVELRSESDLHAFAVPAGVAIDIPAAPTVDEARAAGSAYPGHGKDRSPDCLACGPDRAEHDGLRIFPGSWGDDESVVAGVWTPHPSDGGENGHVPTELVWAALECTELWSLIHDATPTLRDRVVTRSLATRVERPVAAGRPHVVIGWPIARDRRMILAGGAVFDADGSLCAVGRQTAVVVAAPAAPAAAVAAVSPRDAVANPRG